MSSPIQILLVEDAKDVQMIVKSILGSNYHVTVGSNSKEGLNALKEKSFSLVVLDINLPDGDGFVFCTQLRADPKHKHTPVFFLTGKNQTEDKVKAFAIGADDYIVKPLDPAEFKARVDAKIRRLSEELADQNIFEKAPFRVLLAQQKIFLVSGDSEKDLELSSIEFKLLYYFLRNENQVLSRAQILNDVWGTGIHITDRAVDTYVYALRKKLGDHSSLIESVPRVGYRYAAKPDANSVTG